MDFQFLNNELSYALVWTLLHSVWQIALAATILSLLLRWQRQLKPETRYLTAFATLGAIAFVSLLTFTIHYSNPIVTTTAVIKGLSTELMAQPIITTNWFLELVDHYQHTIVYFWLAGTLFFLLKLVGGYSYIRRLAEKAQVVSPSLNKKLQKLKAKFKIHRTVELKESAIVTTPMVVGFLKPIILFPIGLVNQLTGEEVAAILAHELAHIKRNDFILNLVQAIAEAVFYFHPGMWYISKIISRERENCCDDLAIQHTGNSISYAKTLIKLQELKLQNIKPALAMAGPSSHFGLRIKRILDLPIQDSQLREKLIATLFLCLSMMGFMNEQHQTLQVDSETLDVFIIDDCPRNIDEIKYYVDTIPERNNFHVKRSTKDRDIELVMEDGAIKELKIDGQIIPEKDYGDMHEVIVELLPDRNREIITVFPDCGEGFGNIYYLDKDRQVVNLDAILENVSARMNTFENFEQDRFDFHSDQFNKVFIDSLRIEMGGIDLEKIVDRSTIQIDSIFDLLPTELPSWSLAPEWFSHAKPSEGE